MSNYWGYNPFAFFVVETRYAATEDPLLELRQAIEALHQSGLEVILDVVYNHSAESDEKGPTITFRGLDNKNYYKLDGNSPGGYLNVTGCGNTLDLSHPAVLELAISSLRYWVEYVGVDGFRFDLATTLGRDTGEFSNNAGFFAALASDPVLSRVKLIAEPWDIGPGGYQLGEFGVGWAEWNDRFRDGVRAFWRGEDHGLSDLAKRLLGSAEIFEQSGRPPSASINLITAHDGFTLLDLVSYEHRHNHANLEQNRDGHAHNLSWNNGFEGFCDDPQIVAARLKDRKNLLATLFLSQGTPMLLMGDELGRTQNGNNNAYCQDNETSWLDWNSCDSELLNFCKELINIRKSHAIFRQERFLHGENGNVCWWHPEGRVMRDEDWGGDCVGLILKSYDLELLDGDGVDQANDNFLFMVNRGDSITINLPSGSWRSRLTSAKSEYPIVEGAMMLEARSFVLLQLGESASVYKGIRPAS